MVAVGGVHRRDLRQFPDQVHRNIRPLLILIQHVAGEEDQIRLLLPDFTDKPLIPLPELAVVQIRQLHDAKGLGKLRLGELKTGDGKSKF